MWVIFIRLTKENSLGRGYCINKYKMSFSFWADFGNLFAAYSNTLPGFRYRLGGVPWMARVNAGHNGCALARDKRPASQSGEAEAIKSNRRFMINCRDIGQSAPGRLYPPPRRASCLCGASFLPRFIKSNSKTFSLGAQPRPEGFAMEPSRKACSAEQRLHRGCGEIFSRRQGA